MAELKTISSLDLQAQSQLISCYQPPAALLAWAMCEGEGRCLRLDQYTIEATGCVT